jgi:hypothetical protein
MYVRVIAGSAKTWKMFDIICTRDVGIFPISKSSDGADSPEYSAAVEIDQPNQAMTRSTGSTNSNDTRNKAILQIRAMMLFPGRRILTRYNIDLLNQALCYYI